MSSETTRRATPRPITPAELRAAADLADYEGRMVRLAPSTLRLIADKMDERTSDFRVASDRAADANHCLGCGAAWSCGMIVHNLGCPTLRGSNNVR